MMEDPEYYPTNDIGLTNIITLLERIESKLDQIINKPEISLVRQAVLKSREKIRGVKC